jgi:hypothetical protein
VAETRLPGAKEVPRSAPLGRSVSDAGIKPVRPG